MESHSILDLLPDSSRPSDSLFGLYNTKFQWDDFALSNGSLSQELSQVLSPNNLFSLPLETGLSVTDKAKDKDALSLGLFNDPVFRDFLAPHYDARSPGVAPLTDAEALQQQSLFQGLYQPSSLGTSSQLTSAISKFVPAPISAPPLAASIAAIASLAPETTTAPVVKGAKKSKRKKGRPELQRRKRSEMNDRFEALKALCHPDVSESTVIGRGDRSTNSKEAILRIATAKIGRLQKEIALLERKIASRRQRNASSPSSVNTTSPSSATPNPSSQSDSIDFNFAFRRSAIARIVMTLDGTVVDCNRACLDMLDIGADCKPDLKALQQSQTIFTLVHRDTLPLVFQNLSLLLSRTQPLTYIINGKGPVTQLNRIPVWSAMSWLSTSETSGSSSTTYMESLLVQTSWAAPTEADLLRPSLQIPIKSQQQPGQPSPKSALSSPKSTVSSSAATNSNSKAVPATKDSLEPEAQDSDLESDGDLSDDE